MLHLRESFSRHRNLGGRLIQAKIKAERLLAASTLPKASFGTSSSSCPNSHSFATCGESARHRQHQQYPDGPGHEDKECTRVGQSSALGRERVSGQPWWVPSCTRPSQSGLSSQAVATGLDTCRSTRVQGGKMRDGSRSSAGFSRRVMTTAGAVGKSGNGKVENSQGYQGEDSITFETGKVRSTSTFLYYINSIVALLYSYYHHIAPHAEMVLGP